jgi:hypothetical protein
MRSWMSLNVWTSTEQCSGGCVVDADVAERVCPPENHRTQPCKYLTAEKLFRTSPTRKHSNVPPFEDSWFHSPGTDYPEAPSLNPRVSRCSIAQTSKHIEITLTQKYGVGVPDGYPAFSPEEAEEAAKKLGMFH